MVSTVFLACYLVYHYQKGGGTPFPVEHSSAVRSIYYAILISHVILATYVPIGAVITISYALRDNRTKHRKWARRTFPIWLYVSITGVVVYWMLYRLPHG